MTQEPEAQQWVHETMRRQTEKDRGDRKDKDIRRRRFNQEEDFAEELPIKVLLARLRSAQFKDRVLLGALRQALAGGDEDPKELFSVDGALHGLVGVLAGGGEEGVALVATQVVANLSPLSEKEGIELARAAGPYLVTLLASGSTQVQEASAVAMGNLALCGPRVVRVLVNQAAVESLLSSVRSTFEGVRAAAYYALYHLLHTCLASVETEHLQVLAATCEDQISSKSPLELHWVLFVLSCQPDLHESLNSEALVSKALDTCTYEIFQKSDSRPLVKIVTPIVRFLSNLCAGPCAEAVCLMVLRYPDLQAILMALLGTNYSHLCKETLCWFSNIVNNESMVIQEELVELDFMDKMEFHTVQAIQKLDPYLTNVIN